jgi:hypothetical protein
MAQQLLTRSKIFCLTVDQCSLCPAAEPAFVPGGMLALLGNQLKHNNFLILRAEVIIQTHFLINPAAGLKGRCDKIVRYRLLADIGLL